MKQDADPGSSVQGRESASQPGLRTIEEERGGRCLLTAAGGSPEHLLLIEDTGSVQSEESLIRLIAGVSPYTIL